MSVCIIDLQLCSRILYVPNEKNSCNNLSNGNIHLSDIIHPNYHITFPLCVYENVLIFVPISFSRKFSLSLILFLCLSGS
jgi:hypothetical protein